MHGHRRRQTENKELLVLVCGCACLLVEPTQQAQPKLACKKVSDCLHCIETSKKSSNRNVQKGFNKKCLLLVGSMVRARLIKTRCLRCLTRPCGSVAATTVNATSFNLDGVDNAAKTSN